MNAKVIISIGLVVFIIAGLIVLRLKKRHIGGISGLGDIRNRLEPRL